MNSQNEQKNEKVMGMLTRDLPGCAHLDVFINFHPGARGLDMKLENHIWRRCNPDCPDDHGRGGGLDYLVYTVDEFMEYFPRRKVPVAGTARRTRMEGGYVNRD